MNYGGAMETPMEKIVKTIPQGQYSVIVLTPPVTVYAQKNNGTRQKIAVWKEAKSYQFVALTRATVFCDGEIGHLNRTFNGASVDGNGGGDEKAVVEGEPFVEPAEVNAEESVVQMQHETWCSIPADSRSVLLTPAAVTRVCSMQLLIEPATDLELGWLVSAADEKSVYWPFGEPLLVSGYRYCITLVQLRDMIVANMTPLGAV